MLVAHLREPERLSNPAGYISRELTHIREAASDPTHRLRSRILFSHYGKYTIERALEKSTNGGGAPPHIPASEILPN
jgi:hypothetical protein